MARLWYLWRLSWTSTDIWRISIAAANVHAAKPSPPIRFLPRATQRCASQNCRPARSIRRRALAAASLQRWKRYRPPLSHDASIPIEQSLRVILYNRPSFINKVNFFSFYQRITFPRTRRSLMRQEYCVFFFRYPILLSEKRFANRNERIVNDRKINQKEMCVRYPETDRSM